MHQERTQPFISSPSSPKEEKDGNSNNTTPPRSTSTATTVRPAPRDKKEETDASTVGEQLAEEKRRQEEGKAPSSIVVGLPEEKMRTTIDDEDDNDEQMKISASKRNKRRESFISTGSLPSRQKESVEIKEEDNVENGNEKDQQTETNTNNKVEKVGSSSTTTRKVSPIRSNSPKDRNYVMPQEELPASEKYWNSADCNPFKSESGIKEKEQRQEEQNRKKSPPNNNNNNNNDNSNNTNSGAVVVYNNEQHQRRQGKPNPLSDPNHKMTIFEFSMPPQEKDAVQQQLKKQMPGAVVVSSKYHPLQNKGSVVALSSSATKNLKKVQRYRKNPHKYGTYRQDTQYSSDDDDEQEEELGNFVKIPPIKTTKGGIASKMRNSNVLKQMKPEVLHVGENYENNDDGNNSSGNNKKTKKSTVAHEPDALERKALDLLVVHDHTNRGSDKNSFGNQQKLAIISPPKQQKQHQPSSTTMMNRQAVMNNHGNNNHQSHSQKLRALNAQRQDHVKDQFSKNRQGNINYGGGAEGKSPSSIPQLIRTVAEEARNAEVVVYENYDREFAQRKLKSITDRNKDNSKNNNSPLRHPETSRVYPQKFKAPEGFSSTEEAILNLARQHEAKKFYSGSVGAGSSSSSSARNGNNNNNNQPHQHPFFQDQATNPHQLRNNHYNLNHKVVMANKNAAASLVSSSSPSSPNNNNNGNNKRFASATISSTNFHNPMNSIANDNNASSSDPRSGNVVSSSFQSSHQENSSSLNSPDLRSMESLLGVATTHKKLADAVRNLERSSQQVMSLNNSETNHQHASLSLFSSSGRKRSNNLNSSTNNHDHHSHSSARNGNVIPSKPVFPRSYFQNHNNNSQGAGGESSPIMTTVSVYPNAKEQDVRSWLKQRQGIENNSNTNHSNNGTLLAITNNNSNNNATTTNHHHDKSNGALILAYQQDAKNDPNNNKNSTTMVVPGSYPGARERIVNISNNTTSSSSPSSFSLMSSPRTAKNSLNATNGATTIDDINYLPSALPSIPQNTPMKFSDLMKKRLEQAEREAIPLN